MRRPAPPTAALLVTALAFHVDTLLYYLLVPLLPRYARDLDLNPMKVGMSKEELRTRLPKVEAQVFQTARLKINRD